MKHHSPTRIDAVRLSIFLFVSMCFSAFAVSADASLSDRLLDEELHHIRNGAAREWASFPEEPEDQNYELRFEAVRNDDEQTLQLTQVDVKQAWEIRLNDSKLGRLHRDENSTIGYWAIPAGTLKDGENVLLINTTAKEADDVRIGDVHLIAAAMEATLNAATVRVSVRDADNGQRLPCRVTILRKQSLMTVGALSSDEMAVRPGVVYCKGEADFGLPAGRYEITVGRGPEYSLASETVTVKAGETSQLELSIRREVPTDGFVACDTHVHTLTHSGHGDSSVRERLLTLAGEAIELPIATDHNTHVSYDDLAKELGLQSYFTPVIGNEVTTKQGHFNVFPIASTDVPIPNYKAESWDALFESIYGTPNVKIAILNHARDIHSNFRPFGPKHHIAETAQNLDGWTLRANAMEVINSGAQQTDMMRLIHDWMGLLNAGQTATPVGSSDSHDVARYIVGQGRTYIRCDDSNVGEIDVAQAVDAFMAGRVTVSCGLNADIRINKAFRVGDTVSQADRYVAEIDVKGPSWIKADRVEVFVNGQLVFEKTLAEELHSKAGIKTSLSVDLPISQQQDAFVVAIVSGPGVRGLHWPIGKPYQPTSTEWTARCIAVTGAIWIDSDGDGKRTAAKTYTDTLFKKFDNDPKKIVDSLEHYDRAVAMHAAAKFMSDSEVDFLPNIMPLCRDRSEFIRQAFRDYHDHWRQSQRARVGAE